MPGACCSRQDSGYVGSWGTGPSKRSDRRDAGDRIGNGQKTCRQGEECNISLCVPVDRPESWPSSSRRVGNGRQGTPKRAVLRGPLIAQGLRRSHS